MLNILSSARLVSVLMPSQFWSFVSVLPKILKRCLHDAELALIDRICLVRCINGMGVCPA